MGAGGKEDVCAAQRVRTRFADDNVLGFAAIDGAQIASKRTCRRAPCMRSE
jgi:hypothetical protein